MISALLIILLRITKQHVFKFRETKTLTQINHGHGIVVKQFTIMIKNSSLADVHN